MLDDIDVDAEGQHVVVVDNVLLRVERAELAVNPASTPRDLGLVVGLERDDVQQAVPDDEGAWILRRNGESPDCLAAGHVDHGDLVVRREGHIGLGVAGEGDADRFVEAGHSGFPIEILDGGDNLQVGKTLRVGVNHAHRVRDVVCGPDLETVRPHRETDRVDADVDPGDDGAAGRIDDVDRVSRRIRDEDIAAVHGNRRRMRTIERRMSDIAPAIPSPAPRGLNESRRGRETGHAPGASVEGKLPGVRYGERCEASGGNQYGPKWPWPRTRHRSGSSS